MTRTFERDYLQFVDDLVFGESVSFTEARSVFIECAEQLMSAVTTSLNLEENPQLADCKK